MHSGNRMGAVTAIVVAAGCIAACIAYGKDECDSAFQQEYRACEHFVATLRPDKPSQARVFAVDGSEFTAGQVLWMRGQLREVGRLCTDGLPEDQARAAQVLNGVEQLLKSRARHA